MTGEDETSERSIITEDEDATKMKRSQNHEEEDGGGCGDDGGGSIVEVVEYCRGRGCDEDEAGPKSRKESQSTPSSTAAKPNTQHAHNILNGWRYIDIVTARAAAAQLSVQSLTHLQAHVCVYTHTTARAC